MGQSIKKTELAYYLRDPTTTAIKNKTSWNLSAIKQLEWYNHTSQVFWPWIVNKGRRFLSNKNIKQRNYHTNVVDNNFCGIICIFISLTFYTCVRGISV